MRKSVVKQKLSTVKVPGRVGRRVSIAPKLLKEDGTTSSKKETEDEEVTELGEPDEYSQKQVQKPEDQLQLTEEDLKEEHTRILTASNPQAPQNIVRFNFKTNQYERVPTVDQLAVHFQLEGNLLHVDSEEAKAQQERQQKEELKKGPSEEISEGGDTKKGPSAAGPLRNQFNFSERAAQTYNNPFRSESTKERGMVTDPPPRSNYAANCTQWEIYDAYMEDQAAIEAAKEGKKAPPMGAAKKEAPTDKKKSGLVASQASVTEGSQDLYNVMEAMKIVERMIIQNNNDELYVDFKYWEDPRDENRDGGELLPLWHFKYEPARKLAATDICWNHTYADLFVASFGSYDFLTQSRGMILFYSLKNQAYPEYIFPTESGAMSVDIHPEHPYLFVAGFYDGNVAVYNIADGDQKPAYQSSARSGKHTDPVWQVRWQPNDLDDNMNFFSVSSDGRVMSWTVKRNELNALEVVRLQMADVKAPGPDNTFLKPLSCGTAIDFHQQSGHLFLVGTEEGGIHKCSKLYSDDEFLSSWPKAHHMAVYKVVWNTYHPDIFLSCSADWTIKLWDHNLQDPLFTYDISSAVADVTWAPYSSTVFAACTTDGKVLVWDLNEDKWDPICEQQIIRRKKLTHLSFNPTYPILAVGDERGHVLSFKLSPNLRKKPKVQQSLAESLAKDKAQTNQGPSLEIEKMQKIIDSVREPDSGKHDD